MSDFNPTPPVAATDTPTQAGMTSAFIGLVTAVAAFVSALGFTKEAGAISGLAAFGGIVGVLGMIAYRYVRAHAKQASFIIAADAAPNTIAVASARAVAAVKAEQ